MRWPPSLIPHASDTEIGLQEGTAKRCIAPHQQYEYRLETGAMNICLSARMSLDHKN